MISSVAVAVGMYILLRMVTLLAVWNRANRASRLSYRSHPTLQQVG